VNDAGAPAAADTTCVGISAHKIMKVIKDPRLAAALLNAQFRIRSRASVPLSTRLSGKIRNKRTRALSPRQRYHPDWERGADRAHLLRGRRHHNRRPHLHQLRFVTRDILLIVWRRAIRLASSATSNLATLVHRRSSLPVPLAPLVREWGCRVGGSRPEGRYQAAGIGGRASIPPEVPEPVRRQRCVDTNTGDKSRAGSDDNVGIMAAQQIPLLCT
jgi:hypothetical protein